MCEKYVYNYYDYRYVESYNPEFVFLSNIFLMDWEILTSSLSGQVILTKMLISISKKKKTSEIKKSIITLAGTTGQRELNKRLIGLIFQDVLSFTAKNM